MTMAVYYAIQMVVTSCVDHCLLVRRTDFLFGVLYEYFSADSVAKATYLECLEPYILNDTLTSVTPVVMKDFVEHYESRGSLTAVEACVTHMDIASLDIHQVRLRLIDHHQVHYCKIVNLSHQPVQEQVM